MKWDHMKKVAASCVTTARSAFWAVVTAGHKAKATWKKRFIIITYLLKFVFYLIFMDVSQQLTTIKYNVDNIGKFTKRETELPPSPKRREMLKKPTYRSYPSL